MKILSFIENTPGFENALDKAVSRLKSGKLVAIPTETVYGLAGDASNGLAIAEIFQLKQRPSFNPLIAHVSNAAMADEFGEIQAVHQQLINAFWPGPLTIIFDLRPNAEIHELGRAGLDSIAMRCPTGPSRNLIEAFGRPLLAPSANRSGRISPTNARHVASEFSDWDGLILDGGQCKTGIESTIVKVVDQKLVILRHGIIDKDQLEAVVDMPVHITGNNEEIIAPGMMRSHYAPDAQVQLNCTNPLANSSFLQFGDQNNFVSDFPMLNLSESENLIEAASNLYAHLRQLDGSGAKTICVAPIPNEGLGIAINDRLERAAAPRVQNNKTEV